MRIVESSNTRQKFFIPCKFCGEPEERTHFNNGNVTCFTCKKQRLHVAYLKRPKKEKKPIELHKKRKKKSKVKVKELSTPFDIWGKKSGKMRVAIANGSL